MTMLRKLTEALGDLILPRGAAPADGLSDEMLLLIMRYVGWADVARSVMLVCRRWHDVGSDNSLWAEFYSDRTWFTWFSKTEPSLQVFAARHRSELAVRYWWRGGSCMERMPIVHPRDLPTITLDHDTEVNVVVQGSEGVGKSALTMQYLQGVFDKGPVVYPENPSYRKRVLLNNHSVILDIMDTAYEAHLDIIYPEHNVLIMVYSATSLYSFANCHEYMSKIVVVKGVNWMPMVLVENKSDLVNEREVPEGVGEKAAESTGCLFVRASARTGEGVEEAFMAAAKLCLSSKPGSEDKKLAKNNTKNCRVS